MRKGCEMESETWEEWHWYEDEKNLFNWLHFSSRIFSLLHIPFWPSAYFVSVYVDCGVDWKTSSIKVKCSSNQANKILNSRAILRMLNFQFPSQKFHSTISLFSLFWQQTHKLFAHIHMIRCGLNRRSFVWKLYAL